MADEQDERWDGEPIPTHDHRQEGLNQETLDLIETTMADKKPTNMCPNGSFEDW